MVNINRNYRKLALLCDYFKTGRRASKAHKTFNKKTWLCEIRKSRKIYYGKRQRHQSCSKFRNKVA